ncbi:LAME_0G20054g1_1 [Lachancea meyersii CBS 8951]|uniref:Transcription initiation factor TFIID subunit 13 n=1 Tax=Lachancea meyersii CBS 8951 TaxID=1266667 RepID=A0A1G4KCG8_9SACH|nr:LAME_0G20054g1_1 [Lachancea meyersii CBS 8951]
MSRRLRKPHLFSKDVSALMYAYGDVSQPLPESVHCLDELVSSYLVDICMSAYRTAQTVHRNKIKVEDFKFVLRKDEVKLGRAEELIKLSKIITDANKLFKSSEGKTAKRARDMAEFNDEDGEDEADDDHEIEGGANRGEKKEVSKKRRKTKKRAKTCHQRTNPEGTCYLEAAWRTRKVYDNGAPQSCHTLGDLTKPIPQFLEVISILLTLSKELSWKLLRSRLLHGVVYELERESTSGILDDYWRMKVLSNFDFEAHRTPRREHRWFSA